MVSHLHEAMPPLQVAEGPIAPFKNSPSGLTSGWRTTGKYMGVSINGGILSMDGL